MKQQRKYLCANNLFINGHSFDIEKYECNKDAWDKEPLKWGYSEQIRFTGATQEQVDNQHEIFEDPNEVFNKNIRYYLKRSKVIVVKKESEYKSLIVLEIWGLPGYYNSEFFNYTLKGEDVPPGFTIYLKNPPTEDKLTIDSIEWKQLYKETDGTYVNRGELPEDEYKTEEFSERYIQHIVHSRTPEQFPDWLKGNSTAKRRTKYRENRDCSPSKYTL